MLRKKQHPQFSFWSYQVPLIFILIQKVRPLSHTLHSYTLWLKSEVLLLSILEVMILRRCSLTQRLLIVIDLFLPLSDQFSFKISFWKSTKCILNSISVLKPASIEMREIFHAALLCRMKELQKKAERESTVSIFCINLFMIHLIRTKRHLMEIIYDSWKGQDAFVQSNV